MQWRQKDVEDDWASKNVVNDSQLIVSGTPTYVAYEIKVQAFNNYGNAPEPTVVIGYSGEDSEWILRMFPWILFFVFDQMGLKEKGLSKFKMLNFFNTCPCVFVFFV